MMNPEFKRNIWLSFSRHKLIAMPVLLGLTLLAIAISERKSDHVADTLYFTAIILFVFIVWLWGARNANLSIVDELRDKTWDQQRMSALGPWAMTWGKLLGSTSFNWYGGAFCLAIAIPSALAGNQLYWLSDLLTIMATAVMLHASLIALNLHAGQTEMALIQRGGLGWLAIIVMLMALPPLAELSNHTSVIIWWSYEIEAKQFLLATAGGFAACAVFSAWRVISNALQVPTTPWAWPLFSVLLTVYFAGFTDAARETPMLTLGYFGLFIALIMTYATLFSEPVDVLTWSRLRMRQQKGDWRGWFEHLPLWPTTLLLAFGFALMATFSNTHTFAEQSPFAFFLGEPLNLALMLLRDACIVVFFSFALKAKRPAVVALLYLFVIDALLPFFFSVTGLGLASYLFLPLDSKHGAIPSVAVMATHAAIALGLVVWRLRRATGVSAEATA